MCSKEAGEEDCALSLPDCEDDEEEEGVRETVTKAESGLLKVALHMGQERVAWPRRLLTQWRWK